MAEGNVTVFYSGEVDGVKTSAIAEGMAADANIRIIDKTAASKLLASDDFLKALGKTQGITLEQMKDAGFYRRFLLDHQHSRSYDHGFCE